MLNNQQREYLSEKLIEDNEIANASDLQIKMIRDLVYDVNALDLRHSVSHIFDVLSSDNNNHLLKRAAGLCLEALCIDQASEASI